MKSTPAEACPRCGSASVPIVYGFPGSELFAAAGRGEIVLGGCEVFEGSPSRRCTGVDCGLEFGELTDADTWGAAAIFLT